MTLILSSSIFFLIYFLLYIKIWNKLRIDTPTGSGIIFLFPMIYLCIYSNINLFIVFIIVFLSIAYYFDDLFSLNYLLRIFFQFFAATLIYYFFFGMSQYFIFLMFLIVFVCLINVINFQDGNDLNLASILLIVFFVVYFSSNLDFIKQLSLISIIFLIIFSFFNKNPSNIYFGDSGCFIITILIFIIILSDFENINLIKNIISVLIFAIIDVLYVILLRIYRRENLLTRNYYHVYQILQKNSKYFFYLVPNILISFINLIIFSNLSFNNIWIMNIIIFNILSLVSIRYILNRRFKI